MPGDLPQDVHRDAASAIQVSPVCRRSCRTTQPSSARLGWRTLVEWRVVKQLVIVVT